MKIYPRNYWFLAVFLGTNLLTCAIARAQTPLSGNYYCTENFWAPTNAAATGTDCYAFGYSADAVGSYSISLGRNSDATGYESCVLGGYAVANENSSIAIGQSASTGLSNNGTVSAALGPSTDAEGTGTTSIGYNSESNGNYTITLGYNALTSGSYGLAIGYYANTTGSNATALGANTTAKAYDGLVVGTYNVGQGNESSSSWTATDDLFVVGNGNSSTKSNAFLIEKNGNIGIGNFSGNSSSTEPSEIIEVSGRLRLDNTALGNTSANGTLCWNGTGSSATLYVFSNGAWTQLGSSITNGTVSLAVGSVSSPSLSFNGSASTGLYSPAANTLALDTDGSEQMAINSSGDVGIGTSNSSLSNTLTVNGTLQFSNSSGNTTLMTMNSSGNLSISSGNVSFGNTTVITMNKRQGDIIMGSFGNGGGD
jgi:trimeric autotransporter adhesin